VRFLTQSEGVVYSTAGSPYGKIYVVDGFSSDIMREFDAPDVYPMGLFYYNGDLISTGGITRKVYFHEGVTSAINSFINVPLCDFPADHGQVIGGVVVINGNLIVLCTDGAYGHGSLMVFNGLGVSFSHEIKIFNHDSPRLLASMSSGLAWDGVNTFISVGTYGREKIWRWVGLPTGATSDYADYNNETSFVYGLSYLANYTGHWRNLLHARDYGSRAARGITYIGDPLI